MPEVRTVEIRIDEKFDDLDAAITDDILGLTLRLAATVDVEGQRLPCDECGADEQPDPGCDWCEGTGLDPLWRATGVCLAVVHRAEIGVVGVAAPGGDDV